ncbi:sigma 54-interacting transcriptional regulator, partial [Streptomyces brasiliscabiei]
EYDLQQLAVLSQLCAIQLKTTLLLQQYQNHAQHSNALVQELNREALTRDGVEIIGQSAAMQSLKNDLKLVAGSEFSVLIQGDTGVGKE